MSKRDDRLLIEDMIEASIKIKDYCGGLTYDQFVNDPKTVDAVIRNFEIIGEAAGRLHPDVHASNPGVEWPKIIAYRNRLIHEYFGIDYEIVWQIIEDELDELIQDLEGLL